MSFLNQQLALGPHKTKSQIKSDMEGDMSNYYTKVDMVNERFIMKQSDAELLKRVLVALIIHWIMVWCQRGHYHVEWKQYPIGLGVV